MSAKRVAELTERIRGWDRAYYLADAPVVVMASGHAAPRFAQFAWLPQRAARGQVSHLPASATPPLDVVVCKLGYAMPAIDGVRLIGATLQGGDTDTSIRAIDHQENLARLNLSLSGFTAGIDPATLAPEAEAVC